jgi:hypothetical protein
LDAARAKETLEAVATAEIDLTAIIAELERESVRSFWHF